MSEAYSQTLQVSQWAQLENSLPDDTQYYGLIDKIEDACDGHTMQETVTIDTLTEFEFNMVESWKDAHTLAQSRN